MINLLPCMLHAFCTAVKIITDLAPLGYCTHTDQWHSLAVGEIDKKGVCILRSISIQNTDNQPVSIRAEDRLENAPMFQLCKQAGGAFGQGFKVQAG
jgi:hypothetical protein